MLLPHYYYYFIIIIILNYRHYYSKRKFFDNLFNRYHVFRTYMNQEVVC